MWFPVGNLSLSIFEPFLKNKKLLFLTSMVLLKSHPDFFHQCTDKTLKYRNSQNFAPVGRLLDGNKMAINEDGMLLIKGVQITLVMLGIRLIVILFNMMVNWFRCRILLMKLMGFIL